MMYQNKLVATIKVNGKVLRETNGTVAIPFGSEYSVFVKNLNSRRALVKISVDGEDGTWLIVQPNNSIELERFIRNNNLNSGNKFKFIERTDAIEEHRGIKADDGLVRIEYKFEREHVQQPIVDYGWDNWPKPCFPPIPWDRRGPRLGDNLYKSARPSASGSILRSTRSTGISGQSVNTSNYATPEAFSETSCAFQSSSAEPTGITVDGGISHQQFVYGENFETETQSHVIVLRLVGELAGKKVSKPITVKTKVNCSSCNLKNKPGAAYCSRCGTGLLKV